MLPLCLSFMPKLTPESSFIFWGALEESCFATACGTITIPEIESCFLPLLGLMSVVARFDTAVGHNGNLVLPLPSALALLGSGRLEREDLWPVDCFRFSEVCFVSSTCPATIPAYVM